MKDNDDDDDDIYNDDDDNDNDDDDDDNGDLKPLNTSKRALNTNPPFFWDTLYIHESKHKPTFHIQFSPRLGECGGILPNLNSCWCSSLLAPCWPVTFLHYTAALFHTCDQ